LTTELIGGVRWGFRNATWPFAKLSVDAEGITIRRSRRYPWFFKNVDLSWAEISQVEKVEEALPLPKPFGVQFKNVQRRLIWWGGSSESCDALVELVAGYVPEKIDCAQPIR
jgi:hypothetical protein